MEYSFMRRTLPLVVALGAVLLALTGVRCGGEVAGDPTPTSTPTSPTVTASPPPTATATATPGATDDDRLNRIIDAAENSRTETLISYLQMAELPCTFARGTGGMPSCNAGEREGTTVRVLPVTSCRGTHIDEADLLGWLNSHLLNEPLAFDETVSYRLPISDGPFPTGSRALVFSALDGLGRALGIDAKGRVVSVDLGCGQSSQELAESLADGVPYGDLAILQSTLSATIQDPDVPGSYTIAITDLQTGRTIGVNDDIEMASGCIMNFLVILEVLREVEAGSLLLDDVDALIQQTIYASDAGTAYQLYSLLGDGDAALGVAMVAGLIADLGLEVSRIDHPPAFQFEVFEANIITAAEINEVLVQLYAGDILNEELTAYLLEAMTGVKAGLNYLTGSLPSEALVSHKNGFFYNDGGWVDNDTAIVRWGEDLQYAYAVTFLSDDVEDKYAEIWMAQDMVHDSWSYFASRYGDGF